MNNWTDEHWLYVLQVYLRKPVGVKPTYSRNVVDLAMKLHIHPSVLFGKMCAIANPDTAQLQRLWSIYGENARRLSRDVKQLDEMRGFNNAEEFYEGVELRETFEKDFQPIEGCESLTPVMLILILDLYFRLTTITMVPDTPEIISLARLLKIKPENVVEIMEIYQRCDPYLNRKDIIFSPLMLPCQNVWDRFGNWDMEQLANFASELSEYFIGT